MTSSPTLREPGLVEDEEGDHSTTYTGGINEREFYKVL